MIRVFQPLLENLSLQTVMRRLDLLSEPCQTVLRTMQYSALPDQYVRTHANMSARSE